MKVYGTIFRCYNLNTLSKLIVMGYNPITVQENLNHPGKLVWLFKMNEQFRQDLEIALNNTVDWIV